MWCLSLIRYPAVQPVALQMQSFIHIILLLLEFELHYISECKHLTYNKYAIVIEHVYKVMLIR